MQGRQERIFYDLLVKVGSKHRYQTILMIIVFMFGFSASSNMFYNVFLFHESPYQCPVQTQNCNQYICLLPQADRSSYINNNAPSSFINQFGDYRCQILSQKDNVQSIIYIGGLFGLLFNTLLDQRITKWYIIFVFGSASVVSILITFIAPSLTVATISLFITYASLATVMMMIVTLIFQNFDQSLRQKYLLLLGIVIRFSAALNGPIFYLFSWRIALLIVNMLPLCIGLFLVFKYMQQCPLELVTMYDAQKAYKALLNISRINGLELDKSITVAELANIKTQYQQNHAKHKIQQISILDLFRYDSLRLPTLCLMFLNFAIAYQYDASELSLANYSINIYYSGVILGFFGILGTLTCFYTIQRFQKKKLLSFTQIVCFISSTLVFIFASCNNQEECPQGKLIFQTVGLCIFRFACSIYLDIFFIYSSQIFPNQIRVLGLAVVLFTYQIGITTIPIAESLMKKWHLSFTLIFAIMSVLIFLIQIPLKQTFGIEPPQMIQELKYKHNKLNQKQKLAQ